MRPAVESQLASLPKRFSAAINPSHEGLRLCVSELMLLKILLKRETLRTIITLEGFDTRVGVEVALESKLRAILLVASLSGTFEFLWSSSSWHF